MYYRARPVRPPVEIAAPPFPRDLPWVNVAPLRMDQQIGRPVLVEFWDFCRPNSMRTLPYVREWHERYADDGLRVIGVHTSGVPAVGRRGRRARRRGAAGDRLAGRDRRRLRGLGVLRQRGLARALPVGPATAALFDYHYGEGAYDETERAIQELLGVERELVAPVRPEDEPGAELVAPDRGRGRARTPAPTRRAACGRCSTGAGTVVANGREIEVARPGAYAARSSTTATPRACSS